MKNLLPIALFSYAALSLGMDNTPQSPTQEISTESRYKPLKTLGETLDQLNAFPQLPLSIKTARKMLQDARSAEELCHRYDKENLPNSDFKELENYIYQKASQEYPLGYTESLSKHLKKETKKIVDDCKKCPDYRDSLRKHIRWLVSKAIEIPYYVGLTPGKQLKTPGEILDEINFHTTEQSRERVSKQLNDTRVDITTNHTLLHNAYFANRLCDEYLKDAELNKRDFRNYISGYQAWSFDPSRHNTFEEQNPGSTRDDYSKHLDEETNRIVEDCQRCPYYKKQLSEQIDLLTNNIMYEKNRYDDPIADLQIKTRRDIREENKKWHSLLKN